MARTKSRSTFEGRSTSGSARRNVTGNSSSALQNSFNQTDKAMENPFNQIDNAILETILARLPMADIFHCQFVCKKWKAIIRTPTFSVSLNVLFNGSRSTWFFMLDLYSPANVVYDMERKEWRQIHLPVPTDINGRPRTLVASSKGFMLFKIESVACWLIVCNPLTGSARSLPTIVTSDQIMAITLYVSELSFAVFVLFKKPSCLQMMMFSSSNIDWVQLPFRQISYNNDQAAANNNEENMDPFELRKVRRYTALQYRTPMREMASGVTKIGSSGQLMMYMISPSGRVLEYNSQQGTTVLCPKLIPNIQVCGFDLVECGGRILVVVLTDTLYEIATLRMWQLETTGEEAQWKLMAVMPPFMSRKYFCREADINCAGHGNNIMVCVSSKMFRLNDVIIYNFTDDTWLELPHCFDQHCGGIKKRFVSAYSFMPNFQDNLI